MENDEWVGLPEDLEDNLCFVYIIERINCAISEYRYYIGCKMLKKKVKLKPLKDGKRRKAVIKDSDFKSYYGSSKELVADISKNGKENYRRTILHMCKSKSEMKYLELCEQVIRNVLFDEKSYNGIVNLRIGKFKKGFSIDFDDLYKKITNA